jgi:hypothetical protein
MNTRPSRLAAREAFEQHDRTRAQTPLFALSTVQTGGHELEALAGWRRDTGRSRSISWSEGALSPAPRASRAMR